MEARRRLEATLADEKKKLDEKRFVGASLHDRVTLTYQGGEFTDCSIKDGLDPVLIADLVVLAANKALQAYEKGAELLRIETERTMRAIEVEANQQLAALQPQQGEVADGDGKVISIDKNKN